MGTPITSHRTQGGAPLFRAAWVALGIFIFALPPAAAQPRKQEAFAPPQAAALSRKQQPIVARVNEQDIRLSEVFESIESLSLGDQIDARGELNTYIEAMINEEVLFQWALSNQFDGDKKLRSEVKDLVVRALIEKHVRSRIKIGEAQVRTYYDNNPSLVSGEHVRVRRLLLKKRSDCVRMLRQIDSENAFIVLAKAHSLERETAANGGDSGLIMRGEGRREGYDLEFFKMKVGEMRIFDLPQGCLIVRSIFYTNPPLPPYDSVKGSLRQYLENREEVRLVDRLFKKALRGMKIQRSYGTVGEMPALGQQ